MSGKQAIGSNMPSRRSQSGAAMIEFAFVFPILLLLIYGLVVYAYIFVLQESITFVAQQAASAAVSVSPAQTASAATAQMTTLAQNTVTQYLSWLSPDQLARVTSTVTFCPAAGVTCPTDGSSAAVVTVSFNVAAPTPLFPTLDLGFGTFPPMPAQLITNSTVRI